MAALSRKRQTLSHQLESLMRDCGLSCYEISMRTGIAQAALSRFMSGKRMLSMPALNKLGELFALELVAHCPKPSKVRAAEGKKKER